MNTTGYLHTGLSLLGVVALTAGFLTTVAGQAQETGGQAPAPTPSLSPFVITETDGDTVVPEEAQLRTTRTRGFASTDATDTFEIALTQAPAAGPEIDGVGNTVAYSWSTWSDQIQVSPSTIYFGPENWNTPQTITVTALDDDRVEGVKTETVLFSQQSQPSPRNANLSVQEITEQGGVVVTVEDNDGLLIEDSAGYELTEGGEGVSFNFSFATDPTINQISLDDVEPQVANPGLQIGSVTVSFFPDENLAVNIEESAPVVESSIDTLEETAEPAGTIQFTGSNYTTARSVEITAVDDEVFEGDHTGSVRMTIGSDNENIPYMEQTLEFAITDNDEAPVEQCRFLTDATGGDCLGVPNVGIGLPNQGDGNNDGTPDAEQENVRTAYNSTNTNFVTVAATSPVREIVAVSSANPKLDQFGEIAFAVEGSEADVEVFLYPETPLVEGEEYVAVKIDGDELTPIEGATVSEIVVDGQRVLRVNFSLIDGGENDQDGIVNGIIVDPMSVIVQEDTLTETGDDMNGDTNDSEATGGENTPGGGLIRTGGQDNNVAVFGFGLLATLTVGVIGLVARLRRR